MIVNSNPRWPTGYFQVLEELGQKGEKDSLFFAESTLNRFFY